MSVNEVFGLPNCYPIFSITGIFLSRLKVEGYLWLLYSPVAPRTFRIIMLFSTTRNIPTDCIFLARQKMLVPWKNRLKHEARWSEYRLPLSLTAKRPINDPLDVLLIIPLSLSPLFTLSLPTRSQDHLSTFWEISCKIYLFFHTAPRNYADNKTVCTLRNGRKYR